MASVILFLVQGISFGFSASVAPGPYLAFLMSQTLSGGWRRALPLTFVPLVSDGPIIALVLLVLTQTPDWFVRVLQIVGGLLLLYLAKGAFDIYRNWQGAIATASGEPSRGSFWKGVAMNALSPSPYIFWSTVGGPTLLQGWAQSAAYAIAFIVAFYVAIILGMVLYIIVFATASRIDARLTRTLNLISAIMLLGFGLFRIWQGIVGG
jgi:threonine/homoserine/homoserine lactone efflux protein